MKDEAGKVGEVKEWVGKEKIQEPCSSWTSRRKKKKKKKISGGGFVDKVFMVPPFLQGRSRDSEPARGNVTVVFSEANLRRARVASSLSFSHPLSKLITTTAQHSILNMFRALRPASAAFRAATLYKNAAVAATPARTNILALNNFVRMYSSAGLARTDIEKRVLDILAGFNKVDANKVSHLLPFRLFSAGKQSHRSKLEKKQAVQER